PKVEVGFASIQQHSSGEFVFKEVPTGWFTFKDMCDGKCMIVLDQDEFRIIMRFNFEEGDSRKLLAEKKKGSVNNTQLLVDTITGLTGREIPRTVKWVTYKGDTHYIETRYFGVSKGLVGVEFDVWDWPDKKRKAVQWQSHLQTHYGKYEG